MIGYALADSPAGQAAWIYEKFHGWTDHDGAPESILTMDEMLDDIMLYWVTNTGASSARRWSEAARGGHFAAFEQPAIFVDEVRAGFREIRQRQSG